MAQFQGGLTFAAADSLIWTQYPDSDEWVAYDPASGDIHLLTSSAHELLQFAAAAPATAESLTMQLAVAMQRDLDEEFIAATHDVIQSMDRAGLLRPVAR